MPSLMSALPNYLSPQTILVAALALAILPRALRLITAQYFHKHGEPPLISGWIPYVGVAVEYGKEPGLYLERMR